MYSQKNIKWAKQKLGTCRTATIKSDGCVITTLCNMFPRGKKIFDPNGKLRECEPWVLDWKATRDKMYAYGCNVVHKKFAKLLGLKYHGWAGKNYKVIYPTMARTLYWGTPHFFKIYPDGTIVDPLDGNVWNNWTPKRKKNTRYKIDSYRLYELPKEFDCEKLEKDYQEAKKKYKELKQLRKEKCKK